MNAFEAALAAKKRTEDVMDMERFAIAHGRRERALGPGGYWERKEKAALKAGLLAFLEANREPYEGPNESLGEQPKLWWLTVINQLKKQVESCGSGLLR